MPFKTIALACAGLCYASLAFGQDHLSRPVKFIVPTGAGTISDTVTRMMAQDLQNQYGQSFIVEDRVGANGVLAARSVASAEPDGTTFLVGNVSTHAANEFLYTNLSYDPQNDFVPVSLVGVVPHVLVVSPKLPVKTAAELKAYAKGKPGQLTFASGSSLTVVAMEVVKRGLDMDTLHVPFRAVPQAITEIISGRIDMMVVDFGVAKPFLDSGQIRPLLVTMSARSPLLPGVPAFPEAGFPKLDFVGWMGFFAPKGTPKEAVDRVSAGLRQAAERKENQDRLVASGVSLVGGSPQELDAFTKEQRAMYQRLIKEAGIQPQ